MRGEQQVDECNVSLVGRRLYSLFEWLTDAGRDGIHQLDKQINEKSVTASVGTRPTFLLMW